MQKIQRSICYGLVWMLFLAGIYTSFARAESFAERAASMEAARLYAVAASDEAMSLLTASESEAVQADVCLVENADTSLRAVIGRVTSRSSLMRRDLRVMFLLLCVLYVAFFVLGYRLIEEALCLCEKKYRAALIKYIHDIDGKKRVACLI